MNENTINVEAGDMGLVIAFVLMLGGIVKNFTPINNKFIPLITWLLGGLLYQWLAGGWNDPRQWMMALLSVAGATGLHSATRSALEKPSSIVGLLLLVLLPVGCGTVQKPPSVTEQKFYTIETNVVEVVSWVTNSVPVSSDEAPVAELRTNKMEEYKFTPNSTAQLTAATGAAVATPFSPVAGGVVGAAIMGLFSLWGMFRSRDRANQNEITAIELAQIIETGRQIILTLPDGAKYEQAWKDWMVKHQAETQVIGQVSQLVAETVNKPAAKGAAQTIINLIAAQPK